MNSLECAGARMHLLVASALAGENEWVYQVIPVSKRVRRDAIERAKGLLKREKASMEECLGMTLETTRYVPYYVGYDGEFDGLIGTRVSLPPQSKDEFAV